MVIATLEMKGTIKIVSTGTDRCAQTVLLKELSDQGRHCLPFPLRAQEGVFDDIFSYFSLKPYVVTPHLNRLVKTVHML